jgi:myo-inositol 2-dehydrogenase/D-chiro-inositol 1-dehydrogenase
MDDGSLTTSVSPNGQFRLGLIGAGRMGRTHLEVLDASPGISIAGVAEPNAAARGSLPSSIRTFSTLDDLLADCELDGVLVSAPTDLHLELVSRLMAERLPVLCEKPCGLTVSETEECARAAEVAGCLLQVAYWRRFVPELVQLREQVLAGDLGEILAVNCYQWDQSPPPAEFRDRSGGIFIDMGVHEFDQVRWLSGQEFDSLEVVASRLGVNLGDPDCGQLVAELSGGATALVSLGRWHPDGDSCKVEVFGTAGTASSWFLRPADGDAVFRQALRRQAEHFARTVTGLDRGQGQDGDGGAASVSDAVEALKVAELAVDCLARATPA